MNTRFLEQDYSDSAEWAFALVLTLVLLAVGLATSAF
jgi:hypothetical protein